MSEGTGRGWSRGEGEERGDRAGEREGKKAVGTERMGERGSVHQRENE